MNRIAIFCMNICLGTVLLAATLKHEDAVARAGTLISCDFITTREGGRYVGTYCADYQCKYTVTRVFNSYCPYSI